VKRQEKQQGELRVTSRSSLVGEMNLQKSGRVYGVRRPSDNVWRTEEVLMDWHREGIK